MSRYAVTIGLVATMLGHGARAQHLVVHVKGASEGSGLTFRRADGECYVLTARHIVASEPRRPSPDIMLTLPAQQNFKPREYYYSESKDLAVVDLPSVTLDRNSACGPWPASRNIDDGRTGFLRIADSEGRNSSVSITVRTSGPRSEDVEICENSANGLWMSGALRPGVSGGILFMDSLLKAPVAIAIDQSALTGCVTTILLGSAYGEFSDLIHRFRPPSTVSIVGSVVLPGIGQWNTAQRGLAVTWVVATVAAMGGTAMVSGTETRTRIANDYFGVPRSYPYQVRVYPMRRYAPAVWLLSGALSAAEALHQSNKHGDHTPRTRRVSIHLSPSPADDRPSAVAIGLSF